MSAQKKDLPYPEYLYVFNKGLKGQNLFTDNEDFEVFLNYIQQALTPKPSSRDLRQTFTVNGRVFKGVPHQPKNFYGKIELLAYELNPKYFQILFAEIEKGSLSEIMRALCTRYAIYFNKKYAHVGSIFSGPYKSSDVSKSALVLLTHLFHHESAITSDRNEKSASCTSYKDYVGEDSDSFVKSEGIISLFSRSKNINFKKYPDYEKFVENYELNDDDQKVLSPIVSEEVVEMVFGTSSAQSAINTNQKLADSIIYPSRDMKTILPRFIFSSVVIFVFLFSVGFRNVYVSNAINLDAASPDNQSKPEVSGTSDEIPLSTEELINNNLKTKSSRAENTKSGSGAQIVISINDGAEEVNIRSLPSTDSEIVAKTKEGDSFTLLSYDSGWYKIELVDGKTAYVSDKYAKIVNKN